jgi:hypothetical protein
VRFNGIPRLSTGDRLDGRGIPLSGGEGTCCAPSAVGNCGRRVADAVRFGAVAGYGVRGVHARAAKDEDGEQDKEQEFSRVGPLFPGSDDGLSMPD